MDDGYIRMIHDQSCHLNLSNLRVSTVYLSVFGCDPQHCSKTCSQVQRFKFNCEGWCFHWGPWPFLAQGPCRCNHTLHIFRPCNNCLPARLYKMAQEVRSNVPVLMSFTLRGCGKYSAFHSLSEPSKPTWRIRGWRWGLTVCLLCNSVDSTKTWSWDILEKLVNSSDYILFLSFFAHNPTLGPTRFFREFPYMRLVRWWNRWLVDLHAVTEHVFTIL